MFPTVAENVNREYSVFGLRKHYTSLGNALLTEVLLVY